MSQGSVSICVEYTDYCHMAHGCDLSGLWELSVHSPSCYEFRSNSTNLQIGRGKMSGQQSFNMLHDKEVSLYLYILRVYVPHDIT